MKLDQTQIYLKIARWVHDIMYEPFMELGVNSKELSKQIHCDAWWMNEDNHEPPMDVYARYYNRYGIPNKKLITMLRLAKFEVDWRLRRMLDSYYDFDYMNNILFQVRPYSARYNLVRYTG